MWALRDNPILSKSKLPTSADLFDTMWLRCRWWGVLWLLTIGACNGCQGNFCIVDPSFLVARFHLIATTNASPTRPSPLWPTSFTPNFWHKYTYFSLSPPFTSLKSNACWQVWIWKACNFDQIFNYLCQWESVELWWNQYQTIWCKLRMGLCK